MDVRSEAGGDSVAIDPPPAVAPLEIYLLGLVDFDDIQRLQRRLVYDLGERETGGGALILCEHPPTISVGRSGSRAHIVPDDDDCGAGGSGRTLGEPRRRLRPSPARATRRLPGLPLAALGLDLRRYMDGPHPALIAALGEFELKGRRAAIIRAFSWAIAGGLGRPGGEPLDCLSWIYLERVDVPWSRSRRSTSPAQVAGRSSTARPRWSRVASGPPRWPRSARR